jgi:hypothetical protein
MGIYLDSDRHPMPVHGDDLDTEQDAVRDLLRRLACQVADSCAEAPA